MSDYVEAPPIGPMRKMPTHPTIPENSKYFNPPLGKNPYVICDGPFPEDECVFLMPTLKMHSPARHSQVVPSSMWPEREHLRCLIALVAVKECENNGRFSLAGQWATWGRGGKWWETAEDASEKENSQDSK